MRNRDTRPHFTTARFPGTCPETGAAIHKGDRIAFFPATRTAYAENSQHAEQVRGLDFARTWAMPDADF